VLLGCVVRDVSEAERARALPLDYLELKGDLLCVEAASFPALRARLGRPGPPVRALTSPLPRHLGCRVVGGDADVPRALTVFRDLCERAGDLGVETVVLGSGRARLVPPGFPRDEALRQLQGFCAEAAGICGRRGMTLALEPLNGTETNLVNSCVEARAVVDAVGLADLRMVVDCYHVLSQGLSLAAEVRAAAGAIGHAHTAALPRHCREVDPALQAEFVSRVRDAGYDGRLSIECDFEDFARDAPPAVAALRRLVAR
jgi:sugar phosphate isomerase/epimerase